MARLPSPTQTRDAPVPPRRASLRLYERCIAPDLLAGVLRPVAILTAGQSDAAVALVAFQQRKELLLTVGTACHVSLDSLRAYHPLWEHGGDVEPEAVALVYGQCRRWFARLVSDARKSRLSLVVQIEAGDLEGLPRLAADLRKGGYVVHVAFVATGHEQCRLSMVARYEMRHRAGLAAAPWVAVNEPEFDCAAKVLEVLEMEGAMDVLSIMTSERTRLYEGRRAEAALNRKPRAAQALAAFLSKPHKPRQLAQFAMCWETLAQRLCHDATVPRDVASRVLFWRGEAVARCEKDADAVRILQWAREAAAFRVMNLFEFEKEFPHHAHAVKVLGMAARDSERCSAQEAQQLLSRARENIAKRIEQGEMARIAERRLLLAGKR